MNKEKPDRREQPRTAVVMSGGGLKPLAALPLFDFLDRTGIVPDLLVGCSGGGIMAALRASGYNCAEIEEIVRKRVRPELFRKDWRAILGVLHLPFGRFNRTVGLFRPEGLMSFLESLFPHRRLEDLPVKTILQATNFETGDGVSLETGPLAHAVYAPSAIYPFFPAIQMEGHWLFDGLYSGPLPGRRQRRPSTPSLNGRSGIAPGSASRWKTRSSRGRRLRFRNTAPL